MTVDSGLPEYSVEVVKVEVVEPGFEQKGLTKLVSVMGSFVTGLVNRPKQPDVAGAVHLQLLQRKVQMMNGVDNRGEL